MGNRKSTSFRNTGSPLDIDLMSYFWLWRLDKSISKRIQKGVVKARRCIPCSSASTSIILRGAAN
jgi:hypothetical protein